MPIELTEQEMRHRLQELRNFQLLYPKARERIRLLEQNSYEKDKLIKKQDKIIALQTAAIEQFKLRIEWLEIKVFGKKKDKDKHDGDGGNRKNSGKSLWSKLFGLKKKERSSDTYRRQSPEEDEITAKKDYQIETCPNCKTKLTDFKIAIRYLEDIKILEKELKEVIEQRIQTGFCPCCRKRFSAIEIAKQTVSLGEKVKNLVVYLITISRQGYEQTKNLLKDVYGIRISDGEINSILEQKARQLLPEYNRLKENIRGSPAAHLDETTHKVQSQESDTGSYAWVMTSADTTDTVFELGKNRGKGNADQLLSDYDGVVVTDDYGVYKKLEKHQLCWAHLLRNFRRLAESQELFGQKHEQCKISYRRLAHLYQNLKKELEIPFNIEKRTIAKDKFVKRIVGISKIKSADPTKLQTLKQTLFKNRNQYFTCLIFQNVPSTNNKAERSLRHLVLKRKSSFGSKTKRGADTMSVLFSVLLSLWWKKPDNFFLEYSKMFNQN